MEGGGKADQGYEEGGVVYGKDPKSLMRMLGPNGNPRADNLFAIIREVQQGIGVQLEVKAVA
jgi:hypothetical protein